MWLSAFACIFNVCHTKINPINKKQIKEIKKMDKKKHGGHNNNCNDNKENNHEYEYEWQGNDEDNTKIIKQGRTRVRE